MPFAAALIWLIALAMHDPNDPVWFFSTGTHDVPANFAGRVGAFLSELSYQILGYASYLIPAVMAVAGLALLLVPRHRRGLHEVDRRRDVVRVRQRVPRPDAWPRRLRPAAVPRRRLPRRMAGRLHVRTILSRTGSVIVILALIVAAVILATQFSFGRLFSAILPRAPGQRLVLRSSTPLGSGATSAARPGLCRDVLERYGKKDTPVCGEGRGEEDRKDLLARARGSPREKLHRLMTTIPFAPAAKAAPPVVQKKPVTKAPDGRDAAVAGTRARGTAARHLPCCDTFVVTLCGARLGAENRRSACSRTRRATSKKNAASFQSMARWSGIHPGPVVTTFELKPDAGG